MLLLVYAMLTHVGALSGAAWPGGSTGADTLSNIARGLFGPVGQVLLAAIFVSNNLNVRGLRYSNFGVDCQMEVAFGFAVDTDGFMVVYTADYLL